MKQFNFGIIGTGGIAAHFCNSIKGETESRAFAVYSRKQETADAFKKEHGLKKAYSSLTDFLSDEEIDAVYVATPHNSHYDYAKQAILAKKGVLCEKPMCISEAQAKELFDLAKENGVFLMEAMWSSFTPTTAKIKELIAEGRLGTIKKVYGDFSFYSDAPITHRIKNPDLAGGALYDLGVYSMHFVVNFLGLNYKRIDGDCIKGETGVDYSSTVIINYGDALGVAECAINATGHKSGVISGEKGKIVFPSFWGGNKFTLVTDDYEEEFEVEQNAYPFVYEIRETVKCVRAGKCFSDIETPEKTLTVHKWTDILLKKWGII